MQATRPLMKSSHLSRTRHEIWLRVKKRRKLRIIACKAREDVVNLV